MGIAGKLTDRIEKVAKLRKEDKERRKKNAATREQVRQALRERLTRFE